MSPARSRAEIIQAARAYLGTPYAHQGRTKFGLDCIGLIIRVAHDLGLSDYDESHYSRVPSGRRMQRLLSENCEKIPIKAATLGDLLHIAFETQPQHVAILTDRGMIHADSRHGVVEHRIDIEWLEKVRGAYRLPGVA